MHTYSIFLISLRLLAAMHSLRYVSVSRRLLSVTMCTGGEGDEVPLELSFRQAAAEQLGESLESVTRPNDLAWSRAGADAMVDALREAKQQLEARKAEIGEKRALAELRASICADDRAPVHPVLKAPKLWLLDRDGCINEDVGAPGVLSTADLRLIPGSADAICRLRTIKGKVAVITNQSARGKGLLSADALDAIHQQLQRQLATTSCNGPWDAVYVCEAAEPSWRKKPEPGMILEALQDFGCAPSEALMIGDSWSDVVAARRAGCVGVLLATGHGAALGALLRAQGVRLPVTLTAEATGAATATEYGKLLQSLASSSGNGAARAIEEWVEEGGEERAALVWEALQGGDVRVYADLSQAVDEIASTSTLP